MGRILEAALASSIYRGDEWVASMMLLWCQKLNKAILCFKVRTSNNFAPTFLIQRTMLASSSRSKHQLFYTAQRTLLIFLILAMILGPTLSSHNIPTRRFRRMFGIRDGTALNTTGKVSFPLRRPSTRR